MYLLRKYPHFFKATGFPRGILIYLSVFSLLFISGCVSQEKDNDTGLVRAEEWLAAQSNRYDILTSETHNDLHIILAAEKHPEVEGLHNGLLVFVIRENGTDYSVLAAKTAEMTIAGGFTSAVLATNDMTIIFGDVSDGVYDVSAEAIVPVEFSKATVIYDEGKEESVVLSNNKPYMLVINEDIEVKDIKYSVGETEIMYSDYFSAALMNDARYSEIIEFE